MKSNQNRTSRNTGCYPERSSSRIARSAESKDLRPVARRYLIALLIGVFAVSAPVHAQSFPAGVQGTWKITKMLKPKQGVGMSCANGAAYISPINQDAILQKYVTLDDRTATLEGAATQNESPQSSTMDLSEFAARFLAPGVSTKFLHLQSSKIQLINLGTPASFPFSTIIVQSPSTLIFEGCGFFYEATHNTGFKAPKLPDQ